MTKGEKMIFIPKRDECELWCTYKDMIYVIYPYNDKIKIHFTWTKSQDETYETYNFHPSEIYFYDESGNTEIFPIFNCTYSPCKCMPELRYNSIIKKWFCECSSSLICTKDDDKDELEYPPIKNYIDRNEVEMLNDENGYFDDMFHALMYWNKQALNAYSSLYEELEKQI
jgi:hypothetical protein